MDDIVKEFLVESPEGLDRLDRDLVELEQGPRDQELLAGIFRCVHTVKGTCGFLGFTRLEAVSHVGENLRSLLRDGRLELSRRSPARCFSWWTRSVRFFPALADWKVRILGTELSQDVLARARQGRYSQLEVNRGLPATYMVKHFRKEGMEWQISDAVRQMVEYRALNLIDTVPPAEPPGPRA